MSDAMGPCGIDDIEGERGGGTWGRFMSPVPLGAVRTQRAQNEGGQRRVWAFGIIGLGGLTFVCVRGFHGLPWFGGFLSSVPTA